MPDETPQPGTGAGGRMGRSLGRIVRATRSGGAEREQLSRQVRQAVDHTVPRIKQASAEAAQRTGRFVREHDDEIARAATTTAHLAAQRLAPLPLRPVVAAAITELNRKSAPMPHPVERPHAAEEQGHQSSKSETSNGPHIF